MNDKWLMLFTLVTTVAVLLEAGILLAMLVALKKTADEVSKLSNEVRSKALPAVESVQALIVNNRDRVEEIIENVAVASTTARSQLVRIDATLNDVLDRTRLQVGAGNFDLLVDAAAIRCDRRHDCVHRTARVRCRRQDE